MTLIEHGLYGTRLQRLLTLKQAPVLVAQTSRHATVTVTRCVSDAGSETVSEAFPTESAFLVILHLVDCERWQLWLGERQITTHPIGAGAITIHDLRRSPALGFFAPHDALFFYLPHAALDNIAQEAGAPRLCELRETGGAAASDTVVRDLAKLLLPAFVCAATANRIFIDSVILAIGAHLATTYGDLRSGAKFERGGLAPWQERRAKDMLLSHMDGGVRVATIARACGLSDSQFSRSFRRTTGLPPHQWLMQRRIERAKRLLSESAFNLAQVGQECGFADQSHFTRSFTAMAGVSPGAWRRRLPVLPRGRQAARGGPESALRVEAAG